MKYIIEIEDEPFGRNDDPVIPHGMDELYRVKGFNSLVFDKNGLDKLIPLDKELEEAYQNGYKACMRENDFDSPCTSCDAYQRGVEDGRNETWEMARKIKLTPDDGGLSLKKIHEIFGTGYSLQGVFKNYSASEVIERLKAYEEQQKADEIKVGDIITDGKINYLVIDITDKSYIALQGTNFEPVYIGKDYIKYYHNLHDSKDMKKVAEEINRAVKGEQRNCSECEHDGDSRFCDPCRHNDMWQPKGGAE